MDQERDYQLYERGATEVEVIASRITYEPDKAAMLRIAAEWRAMAKRAAERASVPPKSD